MTKTNQNYNEEDFKAYKTNEILAATKHIDIYHSLTYLSA